MRIWDGGTFEAEKWRDGEVIAVFHGERMKGRYALFRTREDDWMIHRMDPPDDPAYEPFPDRIAPMLARSGSSRATRSSTASRSSGTASAPCCSPTTGTAGCRAATSPTSPRYPEVRALAPALGARRIVLDGEIVAFDAQGRPSFERLQSRMHLASDSAVRRRLRDIPVTYVIFDLLYLDGHSTMSLSYEQRRELLDELALEGPSWRTPAYQRGEGRALQQATRELGIEGIVAKKLGCSTNRPPRLHLDQDPQQPPAGRGDRGWTPGEGGRSSHLGALAVGVMEEGELIYAGKVGTGFTQETLGVLVRELEPLRRDTSPFSGRQPPKGTVFVEPRLVALVEFREWTSSGTLRAPSFKGLRPDKPPEETVRE